MNCDQVFNVLTRGPFPTGAPDDAEVEGHLADCPSCWEFAEALRPAVDVFEEAVLPAESRDLPGYWGDSQTASQVVAELARRTTSPAMVRSRVPAPEMTYRPSYEHRGRITFRDLLTVVGFVSMLTLGAIGFGWLIQLL